MSHSKRNTSSAFFTAYERSLLKTAWGSQKTRLTRESFLPFGSCQLCMLPSRDPVACPKGDLFCRECAMANLLAQRMEIKRLEKEMEKRREEEVEREAREDEAARERIVREFESGETGMGSRLKGAMGSDDSNLSTSQETKGTKRKFKIDEAELIRIAIQDRQKARKDMEAERKSNSTGLPSFWVPGAEAAAATNKAIKTLKLHPLCPASDESAPHALSLKSLTNVQFTEEPNPNNPTENLRSCPACRKALSNATKAMLAIPCGHILCQSCSTKFQTPVTTPDPHHRELDHSVLRCYVCEEDLTIREELDDATADAGNNGSGKSKKKKKKRDKEGDVGGVKPGLVELRTDGTGFAGSGTNMVEKRGVAFQC